MRHIIKYMASVAPMVMRAARQSDRRKYGCNIFGTVNTHCAWPTGSKISSRSRAAVCAARLAPQEKYLSASIPLRA